MQARSKASLNMGVASYPTVFLKCLINKLPHSWVTKGGAIPSRTLRINCPYSEYDIPVYKHSSYLGRPLVPKFLRL